MSAFLVTLAVGVGSYVSRSLFILALARKRIPDRVLVALQFVAPAVLGSLVIAVLIDSEGQVSIGVPEAAALVVGAAVAYRTKNHILTLVVGMIVYWVLWALV
jgi:branched-subunit amino acid transport protein